MGIDESKLHGDVKRHGLERKPSANSTTYIKNDLCMYCAVAFDNFSEVEEYFSNWDVDISLPYFDCLGDIRSSANKGCALCRKFIALITFQSPEIAKDESTKLEPILYLRRYPGTEIDKKLLYMSIVVGKEGRRDVRACQHVNTNLSNSIVQADKISPSVDTSSSRQLRLGCLDNSTELAREWLSRCRKTHETCSQKQDSKLPSRLIKIEAQESYLHLVESTDTMEYVTLSHCWGSHQPLRLLKANLSEFTCEIPRAKLCKTFIDAITITKTLGYSYLWIDSLCIIQDDDDNWSRVAVQMAQVYGAASLNLAASAASNGDTGCLFERDVTYTDPVFLRVSAGDKVITWSLFPETLLDDNISDSPLASRAWCLQERLLARRTLFFTRSQLFWECEQALLCETFPDESLGFVHEVWRRGFTKSSLQAYWNELVYVYSTSRLSHSQDRPMAIAGLARRFAQQTGGEYIAGMWKETLLRDLCWETIDRGSKRRTSIGVGSFPSWSWLIFDDPIYMPPNTDITYFAKLSHIDVVYATGDHYGNIASGKLTLDVREVSSCTPRSTLPQKIFGLQTSSRLWLKNPEEWTESDTVYTVPIFGTEISGVRPSGVRSLLLMRNVYKPGHYSRIGLWHAELLMKDLNEKLSSNHEDSQPADIDEDLYVCKIVDNNEVWWYRIVIE